jgi:hypothetical protein
MDSPGYPLFTAQTWYTPFIIPIVINAGPSVSTIWRCLQTSWRKGLLRRNVKLWAQTMAVALISDLRNIVIYKKH